MGGMHTGIGTACRTDAERLAGKRRNGLLDGLLHTAMFGLMLPARIGRAVIFDDQLVTWHQEKQAPAWMG